MSDLVLFDFADTLAELQPRREAIVADYIAEVGDLRVSSQAIVHAYKAIDLLMPYSSVKVSTQRERAAFYEGYNRRMFDLLGVSHRADPAGMIAAFGARKSHWKLKTGALDVLNHLRWRGYRIGIISNFDDRLKQIVQDHLRLGDIVDYLHISQTEGVEKPDPRFYLGFFKRHGLPIQRSVYVGDSYTLDFLPAHGIGLDAWLLDEAGIYPHLPQAIRGLDEVLALVPETAGIGR